MMKHLGKRSRQLLFAVVFVYACLGSQYFGLMKQHSFSDAARTRTVEVPYVPPKPVLRVLSLGYPDFAADLMFIRASLYFSTHLLTDRKFEWLELYLYSAQYLSPRNFLIYKYGAMNLKLGEYVISKKNVMKSIAFAELGLDYFPDSWWLYEHIGWEYLFQLRDLHEHKVKKPSAKQLKLWEEKGIEYYRIASELNPMEVDPALITQILTKRGRLRASLQHLMATYLQLQNPRRRQELAQQLRQLNVSHIAVELESLYQRWEKDMPYLPINNYILMDSQSQLGTATDWKQMLTNIDLEGL